MLLKRKEVNRYIIGVGKEELVDSFIRKTLPS
jgi:hypothetical protein